MKICRSLATLRCVGTQGTLELLRHGEALDPCIFTTAQTRMQASAQKASELYASHQTQPAEAREHTHAFDSTPHPKFTRLSTASHALFSYPNVTIDE